MQEELIRMESIVVISRVEESTASRAGIVVVPKCLQKLALEKVHMGHQDVQRCHLHAEISVWWPGISHELKNMVKQCPVCVSTYNPSKEPLIHSELPDFSWQKVGTDLFHLNDSTYIVAVDYFFTIPGDTEIVIYHFTQHHCGSQKYIFQIQDTRSGGE